MSTFQCGSATLAHAVLRDSNETLSVHARNVTDTGEHAEDGVIAQIRTQLNSPKKEHARLMLSLTIRNFPCNDPRRATGCTDNLIALHKEYTFGAFHIYFYRSHGEPDTMANAIAKLQDAGIEVTAFVLCDDEVPYPAPVGVSLDPSSDDES